jgi:alpha-N-arabinofuranosidase
VGPPVDIPYSGNFKIRDEFNKVTLHPSWIFLRTPNEQWYQLDQKKGLLSIKLRPETCSGNKNPSFIGRRQQHRRGSVSTSMSFLPDSDNEKAGLLVFQNETHFYFLCKSLTKLSPVVELYKSNDLDESKQEMELIQKQTIPDKYAKNEIYLKIESNGNTYSFYYACLPDEWVAVKENVDATFIRAVIPKDFAGAVYALYATSLGRPGNNKAAFDWFDYQGNDEIYNK